MTRWHWVDNETDLDDYGDCRDCHGSGERIDGGVYSECLTCNGAGETWGNR